MAVTTVAPVDLALNVASADLPESGMTSIANGSDGGSIDLASFGGRPIIIHIESSDGGDFTFLAGDRPPSHRTGLGTLVIAMETSDVKFLTIELSRFLQDDGKILFTVSGNNGSCAVFVLPRAV